MTREDPQLKVRVSEEMKRALVDSAHKNKRSLNAEIVGRLEETFQKTDVTALTPEIFDKLFSRLDDISSDIKQSKKD